MDKLGKLELNAWTVMGGLVALYILFAPFRTMVDNLIGGIGGAPAPGVPVIECIYDGAVMTVGPVEKKYAPTTSMSGDGIRVFINGKDRGVQTDGATMDVNYKDDVVLFYAHNATDAEASKNRYYTAKQEFTVPCTSAFSTADDEVDPSDAHSIILGSLPTIAFFNDDTGLLNQKSANETMAASDVANMEMKVVYSSKGGFSPYGNKIICAVYNTTLVDDISLSVISGVSSVSSADTPQIANNQGAQLGSSTGRSLDCWSAPGHHSLDTVTEKYTVTVETKAVTPVAKSIHHAQQKNGVNISIYDENWYRHSETGEMLFGAENDVDGEVGLFSTANGSIRITS